MTNTYRKKLIEVSLPLAAINAESAREKSIRHGHPSTLHLWWARRPLAACRAVLFASLVDDPDSDPQYRKPDGSVDEDSAGIKRADLFNLIEELVAWENSNNPEVSRSARAEIARCVASRKVELKELEPDFELSQGNGKTPKVTVRDLVTKGHCRPIAMGLDKKAGRVRFSFDVSQLPPAEVVNAFLAEHAPPVLDPFAGGGSIPLEAQRLGLRAYASDLNPVPVLINKALIEIPPKFAGRPPVNPESRGEGSGKGKGKKTKALIEQDWPGATGLADDVRYYGKWMRDEAEKRVGHLYPKVEVTEDMAKERADLVPYIGQQLTVIAWLWARTVKCPNPACGAMAPLIGSFNLSSRTSNRAYVRPSCDKASQKVTFTVCVDDGTVQSGTVTRSGAHCICCGGSITFEHIRGQGTAGELEEQLISIVGESPKGRVFLSPTEEHESVAACTTPEFGETSLPDQGLGFRVQRYGITTHRQLFTARQLKALCTFADLGLELRSIIQRDASLAGMNQSQDIPANGVDSASAYADAVWTYLAMCVSKAADLLSALTHWQPNPEHLKIAPTFARPTLSMTWDFAEGNPFSSSSGNFLRQPELVERVLANWMPGPNGIVVQRSAQTKVSNAVPPVVSTDPPYYDNIGYADLSDFFYVWLRRMLLSVYPELFSTVLVPKNEELVSDPTRHGGRVAARTFFESGLEQVFHWIREGGNDSAPFTIYYAFKQSESESGDEQDEFVASTGWDAMLEALARSGFTITGTWPVRTERAGRLRDFASNALASSIVLVCRPRPVNAPLATRREFIMALRRELPDALRNLQHGNIAPVDLAQSAIGPGMAVFTRYAKVLESDGSSMSVRTALGLINQTLDEVLAEQEGEFDGDTRWAISWFEQFGVEEGPFGDAETLSKAKNTAVNGLVEAGIVVAKSGKVRLIRRDELPKDWNPATDKRLTVWEITQHLIHRLDEQGEIGAAQLVAQLGSVGEIARDLAYRLYSTCERKKWAQEAMAYNSLVVAWPELTKLALSNRSRQETIQPELF